MKFPLHSRHTWAPEHLRRSTEKWANLFDVARSILASFQLEQPHWISNLIRCSTFTIKYQHISYVKNEYAHAERSPTIEILIDYNEPKWIHTYILIRYYWMKFEIMSIIKLFNRLYLVFQIVITFICWWLRDTVLAELTCKLSEWIKAIIYSTKIRANKQSTYISLLIRPSANTKPQHTTNTLAHVINIHSRTTNRRRDRKTGVTHFYCTLKTNVVDQFQLAEPAVSIANTSSIIISWFRLGCAERYPEIPEAN